MKIRAMPMNLLRNLCFLMMTGGVVANQTAMVDPYFSPYSGSANLIFLQDLMIRGEDALLRKSDKDSTIKIWTRAFEQLLFWYNINSVAGVTQHEVFGHGYRLRELGYRPTSYTISIWEGGTGYAAKDYYRMTVGESLAVAVAGLEAEQILAHDLKTEWIAKGEIDGRAAFLYNQSQQSIFWYTLITHLGKLKGDSDSSNDIQSYIYFHNHSYPDGELNHKKLIRWTLFNWLDPLTFYSYYSFFHYIAEGAPWKFPMFSLTEKVKYLPNVKIGYAPYAPEAYLENFFLYQGNPVYLYFKGGRRSFGLGCCYSRCYSGRRGSLGFKLDLWNQARFNTPVTVQQLLASGTAFHPDLSKRGWGIALSVTGRFHLFSKTALFSELGGKTPGYLPGHRLDKEIIARVGLTFGNDSLRQKQPETIN
ncbi:MAG: hypothetical protein AAGE99_01670 [Chlamydiota bacterium]